MTQIPRADAGKTCPLYQKDMSEVCHTCAFWVRLYGQNPNELGQIDSWNCAWAWAPILQVNLAREVANISAEISQLSNVVDKTSKESKVIHAQTVGQMAEHTKSVMTAVETISGAVSDAHREAVMLSSVGGRKLLSQN